MLCACIYLYVDPLLELHVYVRVCLCVLRWWSLPHPSCLRQFPGRSGHVRLPYYHYACALLSLCVTFAVAVSHPFSFFSHTLGCCVCDMHGDQHWGWHRAANSCVCCVSHHMLKCLLWLWQPLRELSVFQVVWAHHPHSCGHSRLQHQHGIVRRTCQPARCITFIFLPTVTAPLLNWGYVCTLITTILLLLLLAVSLVACC